MAELVAKNGFFDADWSKKVSKNGGSSFGLKKSRTLMISKKKM